MSEKNTNSVVASFSKLAIVRAALAFLNLGDDGKLESFYGKVIRTLKQEVNVLKQNISQLKFNHDVKIENLHEKLQDAELAFEHAKIDVDITKINTNQAQTDYVDTFLNALDNKYLAVSSLKEQITDAEKSYTQNQKDIQDQIDSLNTRIDFLSVEAEV
jgi:hypothetical protein